MKHIRKFNEDNEIEFEDLILLFAGLSDDVMSPIWDNREGGDVAFNRNIAITIGEYFRSSPFLLKDIVKDSNGNRERVLSYLKQNKPFEINIQIDNKNKVDDMIHALEFIRDNKDQIEYFGYQFEDFYLAKNRSHQDWSINLLTIKYIPKN